MNPTAASRGGTQLNVYEPSRLSPAARTSSRRATDLATLWSTSVVREFSNIHADRLRKSARESSIHDVKAK